MKNNNINITFKNIGNIKILRDTNNLVKKRVILFIVIKIKKGLIEIPKMIFFKYKETNTKIEAK